MCGIAGFVDYAPCGPERANETLRRMTEAIVHRGPDACGYWLDREGRIGLGHRRLSIVDLSPTGAQPMTSESGRYTVIYNGEIYGFLDLRKELEQSGAQFRGSSDTEVLLAAIEKFGIEKAMPKLMGMFAFAIHDHKERQLIFARDRLGKKPLYIGIGGQSMVFASELKSLRQHTAFSSAEIDRDSVCAYVRRGWIPNPLSIYRGIFSLPPGSFVSIPTTRQPASVAALRELVRTYWSVNEAIARGKEQEIVHDADALEMLDAGITKSVKDRMVADVPVGAFLSSGVDSSLVTAYMQKLSRQQIKTYTVRFTESTYNEADSAAAISAHLGTEHTEVLATPDMAFNLVGSLSDIYDEPFADPSQIPTLMVSKLAREFVTVVLSGDGGDELFGGYNRYPQMLSMESMSKKLPAYVFKSLSSLPVGALDVLASSSRYMVPASYRSVVSGDRLKKLVELLSVSDFDQRYADFMSVWKDKDGVAIGGSEPAVTNSSIASLAVKLSPVERMMHSDMLSYLSDDILVKIDRASMSVGLESRAPLLDHRLLELSWRMPMSLRFDGRSGKIALRQLLSRLIPIEMINKSKQGFGAPINDWLRGPLRGWAGDLLASSRLHCDGVFNSRPIQEKWHEHLSGKRNWGTQLWTILMFNAWHDRWSGPAPKMAV